MSFRASHDVPGPALAFAADSRTESDVELEDNGAQGPVLERYAMGCAALGRRGWLKTARCTLFEHHEKLLHMPYRVRRDVMAERREAFLLWLGAVRPKACMILQTLSRSYEDTDLTGTEAWAAIGGPGTLSEAAGTIWKGPYGIQFVPILNYQQYDYAVRYYIARAMKLAAAVAVDKAAPVLCGHKVTEPNEFCMRLLEGYATQPLISFDLETIPSLGHITAFNLSDGQSSISVPWHRYNVYPLGEQKALKSYPLGQAVETAIRDIMRNPRIAKLGHNAAGYDLLELEGQGIEFSGEVVDTLLKHRVLHPHSRHGLQVACATMFPVRPWKSIYKPVNKPKHSDEYWTASPAALRDYGADDAYYTYILNNLLDKQVI